MVVIQKSGLWLKCIFQPYQSLLPANWKLGFQPVIGVYDKDSTQKLNVQAIEIFVKLFFFFIALGHDCLEWMSNVIIIPLMLIVFFPF